MSHTHSGRAAPRQKSAWRAGVNVNVVVATTRRPVVPPVQCWSCCSANVVRAGGTSVEPPCRRMYIILVVASNLLLAGVLYLIEVAAEARLVW